MEKFIKKIYINSPFLIKRIFANAEAIRRNIYRRNGQYSSHFNTINIPKMLTNYNIFKQINDFNNLLSYVKVNIPFYQNNLKCDNINSLNDIEKLPLTNKQLMRNYMNSFVNTKSYKKLWKGKTSGSTGTPFKYHRDKNSMQFEYALYDKLYNFFADSQCRINARISGVNILKMNQKNPPFWYFIKTYKQLQLSAYHIDEKTYKQYLDAFRHYKIDLGTGYASAWLFLSQYILENNIEPPKFKAIITDSEGFSFEDKLRVERAFKCPVYQTYGLGEVGMIALQCKKGHYHIFTERCLVEIVDENGETLKAGEEGEIVVTDLHSFNAPFIRYRTGDRGILSYSECGCGWATPYLKELVGRIDDFVLTSEGRKIGRLSHIAKSAKNILGMQLVQHRPGYIDIRVLPTDEFEEHSMNDVLGIAKDYLGDMRITWKTVDRFEQTKSGKVKYVIRKF